MARIQEARQEAKQEAKPEVAVKQLTEEQQRVNKVWDKLDVPIQHTGRAITLPDTPEKMPLEKAVTALQRRIEDDNQKFNVHERFDAYPHDAAVAFTRAMAELYGWASPKTVMTFFGPKPPEMLSVKTGFRDEDVMQCPMGAFNLPGLDEEVRTVIHDFSDGKGPTFVCYSEIKKRDRHVLLELATKTRELLKSGSIYRGKPIRLGVDNDGDLITDRPPEFLDVTEMTEEAVMFDQEIKDQIATNLLVPLRETTLCRRHNIPLKRGVLLEGPYGTGKSLTARLVARVAEESGWTFILLDKVQGLRVALEFAKRYAPAVVFAEDVDRVAEERDDVTNDLVNIIDGVISKRMEIMTVLTTNFVEKIDPVVLRPGRLDAVISIRAPGPKTVERLLRFYAGALLPEEVKLPLAGQELAGQIPASIRECVERAKLGMIGRRANALSEHDLVVAAQTMKNHLALLAPKRADQTHAEKLAEGLKGVVSGNGTEERLKKIATQVDDLHNNM